jgi:hypothetical protein
VQFEFDLFNYSYKDNGGPSETSETRSYAGGVNVKVGIHHLADLQFVLGWERSELRFQHWSPSISNTVAEGFSDPLVRLKVNILGDDGGPVAMGLMPFVSIPLGSTEVTADAWQGGLILPLAVELPHGFGLGMMYEIDVVSLQGENYSESVSSITVGRDLTRRIGAYAEYFQRMGSVSASEWMPTLDFGITFANDDIQWDCGLNIGLNNQVDDINPFVGVSFRP